MNLPGTIVLLLVVLTSPTGATTIAKHFESFEAPGLRSGVWEVTPTSDGFLWLATDVGLVRFDGFHPEIVEVPATVAASSLYSLVESTDGSLWAGSHGDGLARFHNGQWSTHEVPGGALWNRVWKLESSRDGGLWIGTAGGLAHFDEDQWTLYSESDGMPAGDIWALLEAPDGTLWVGGSQGLVLLTGDGPTTVTAAHGLGDTYVSSLALGPDETVWIGSGYGVISRSDGVTFQSYGEETGLPKTSVESMLFDRQGRVWVGTEGLGLWTSSLWRDSMPAELSQVDDAIGGVISAITEDVHGNVWVASEETGLFEFPRHTSGHTDDARVVVTDLRLGDSAAVSPHFDSLSEVEGPAGEGRLQVSYAVLGVHAPADWQFETRLEGHDAGWVRMLDSRTASYRGLPSGSYVFRAVAVGPDGTRTEEAAPITISVPATLTERTSVRLALALLLTTLAVVAHRLVVARQARHRRLLQSLVSERTAELEVAKNELLLLSRTDDLTGLANRRHFDRTLEQEWARARRNNDDLTLLLLDIDRFKDYNDRFGHPAGDDVLRRVAGQISTRARRSVDLAARYGGEEFAVLLPGMGDDRAMDLAEEIRRAVEELGILHITTSATGYLTLSIGAATLIPGPRNDAAELVQLADSALYRAKNAGRNRVVRSNAVAASSRDTGASGVLASGSTGGTSAGSTVQGEASKGTRKGAVGTPREEKEPKSGMRTALDN